MMRRTDIENNAFLSMGEGPYGSNPGDFTPKKAGKLARIQAERVRNMNMDPAAIAKQIQETYDALAAASPSKDKVEETKTPPAPSKDYLKKQFLETMNLTEDDLDTIQKQLKKVDNIGVLVSEKLGEIKFRLELGSFYMSWTSGKMEKNLKRAPGKLDILFQNTSGNPNYFMVGSMQIPNYPTDPDEAHTIYETFIDKYDEILSGDELTKMIIKIKTELNIKKVPFASELELYLTLPSETENKEEEDLGDYIVRDLLTNTHRSFYNYLEKRFREFKAQAALIELEIETDLNKIKLEQLFDRFITTYLTEKNYPVLFHTDKFPKFKYLGPSIGGSTEKNIIDVDRKFNNLIVYYAMFLFFFDKNKKGPLPGKDKKQDFFKYVTGTSSDGTARRSLRDASLIAINVDFRMIAKFKEVADNRKSSGLFGIFLGNNYNDFINLNQYLDKLAQEPDISTMFEFTIDEFDENKNQIISAIWWLCNAFKRNETNVNYIKKDPLRKFITYQFFFPENKEATDKQRRFQNLLKDSEDEAKKAENERFKLQIQGLAETGTTE